MNMYNNEDHHSITPGMYSSINFS